MPIPGVKVIEDPSARLLYSIDQGEPPAALRDTFVRIPEMVAQPTTVDEVRAVLAHARAHGLPVIPRGSASSGFGAVLSTRGGIVLDLSWFRRILAVDAAGKTARVEPGVRWSDLSRALEPAGLAVRTYPSNCFSTIGGWVATGGYGIDSLRWGHLSRCVRRLHVVLPDGTAQVLHRTDPEFAHFFGSDGQLGVVTEVELELRDAPRGRKPLLFGFDTERAALEFLRAAFDAGVQPSHGNLWNAARMREKNHLLKRHDFPERPALLLCVESAADEAKLRALSPAAPLPHWQATMSWEDRFFPLRAKKLGPGLLAAELVFAHAQVADYLDAADAEGRKRGYEVVAEAQIVGRDTAVVIASFLYDARDGGESFAAGAFAMKLAVTGLRRGGRPYNLGLWYSPFAETKFGDRYATLVAYKRQVDPQRLFNPGKSLDRLFPYSAFLKLFRRAPLLPPWFRKRSGRHEELRQYDWQSSWAVCSKCAACVAHCPAVLAVGDERVSARGKMFLMTQLDRIGPAEAQMVFQCMHCKYCTEVCQSDIRLEDAFFSLEKLVQEKYGRPEPLIQGFLDKVAKLGLMENLPMSKPEPRWVSDRVLYDDLKGSVTRVP